MTEEKVKYFIGLKESALDKAKDRLHQYPEIHLCGELIALNAFVAESTKADFEKLYDVTLRQQTYIVNEKVGRPMQVTDWLMTGTPRVPEKLEDIVNYIDLSQKLHVH